ncbi:MAG: hypothetical protein HY707_06970 [Ignavibacteriae bacterium]|nr:hypothetical protein [Ignavibacteriota bacterium]
MSPQKKKPIPFSFVFDYLHPKEPVVKPMFGCYALYLDGKIVLILRKKKDHRADNGIWIATDRAYHESLRKEFPSMRSIKLLGRGPTNWQVIPESAEDFEASVIRACGLVVKGDPRIGRIPRSKSKKPKTGVHA